MTRKPNLTSGILRALFLVAAIAGEVRGADLLSGFVGSGAWAVLHETKQASVTEIWFNDRSGVARRLGVFPGEQGNLGWSPSGDLVYRDVPLRSPSKGLMGDSGLASPSLISQSLWEMTPSGGNLRQLSNGSERSKEVAWIDWDGERSPAGDPDPEMAPLLQGLERALNACRMGYNSLYRWDFLRARDWYRQSAFEFERLSKKYRALGVFREPFMEYARKMGECSKMAKKEGDRWVCRENLDSIGRLLVAYEDEMAGLVPKSLQVLREWALQDDPVETLMQVLDRTFRSSRDPVEGRISYYYRPQAVLGEAVVTSAYHRGYLVELRRTEIGYRVVDRKIGKTQIDSLVELGKELTGAAHADAVPVIEMVTHTSPKYAMGHCQLGYAHLAQQEYKTAIRSFKRSISLNHRLPEAYNGLGLAYKELPKSRYTAIHYFRKALQHNQDYLDARYNMALVRRQLEEHDVKHDAERLIDIDPNFAPAYKLLGEWYEIHKEDYGRAAIHYARYMALRPEDPEGRRLLSNAYLKSRDYDRIIQLLGDYVRDNPDEVTVLAILAQACIRLDRLEWAAKYYDEFISGVDLRERALYDDPSLLMSLDVLALYEGATGAEREILAKNFWAAKDPDLTTETNERKLQHYSRVWYSRENFSRSKYPWDRRGEVYIRFGEPDHRSRSDLKNFREGLKVQMVRERMAREIYGTKALEMSFLGGPVYAVRSLKTDLGSSVRIGDGFNDRMGIDLSSSSRGSEERLGDQSGQSVGQEETQFDGVNASAGVTAEGELTAESLELLRTEGLQMDGVGPMGDGFGAARDFNTAFASVTVQDDPSIVPWETWVYTEVNGGLEITFTDERMSGVFDFAPPPMDANIPIAQMARFAMYNPQRLAELAFRVTPDYYVPSKRINPVQFYFTSAHFRSEEETGSATIEVYFGIPYRVGRYLEDSDETQMVLTRSVAVNSAEKGSVFRREGDLVWRSPGNLTNVIGGFVPDVVKLTVLPGTYRMEVQVLNRLSGRVGRYRKMLVVDDYFEEGLKLSELELAWEVTETDVQSKFSKDNLQVIPIPTKTFPKGRPVFVYYEIYNLERDDFGQTRYRVEYTVGEKGSRVNPKKGIISRLVRVFQGEIEEIAMGFEQLGSKDTEKAYTELALNEVNRGDYVLKVKVTDLNRGRSVTRETRFRVEE